MLAVSLVALFVFIFGAYAYGATTVLAFRQPPIWGHGRDRDRLTRSMNPVVLVLCAVCTVWFALHTVTEFYVLTGGSRRPGWPDLFTMVLSYSFPPLIMHTVLDESGTSALAPRRRRPWALPVWLMYAAALVTAISMFAAATGLVARPSPFGAWVGLSIGGMFTLCSITASR
jgi:hypothetical protein